MQSDCILDGTMTQPRTLAPFITQASRHFPVLLLTGPRQVGKTTLLKALAEEGRHYVTLDDPLLRDLAQREPDLFLQRYPPPVLIDEVQYAPGLLSLIKMRVDSEGQPGDYWLTGSQPFVLMRGVTESLAGRVAVVSLLGLSWAEAHGRAAEQTPFLPSGQPQACPPGPGLKALYQAIWRGSFPAMVLDPELDRDLFYGSYVQTYLQRDIRDLTQVADLGAFTRFLRVAAARTGQMLNMADMARDAGIAPNTCKAWLSLLEASGIVYLLSPWHSNTTKRLVKTPKLYFLDTGLAAYLTQWSSPETLEAGAMSGAMLESWVVAEVIKSWWHNGKPAPLYYYRDKDQREIDLLIEQDGQLHPVEIKRAIEPGPAALRHFQAVRRQGLPLGRGAVIALVREPVPLSADVDALPVSAL